MALLLVNSTIATHAFAVDLIEAARNQDSEAVQSLLADGSNPNTQQADGATALHWAVYGENSDMTASLIEAGADVNTVNRLGASALYIAAKSG